MLSRYYFQIIHTLRPKACAFNRRVISGLYSFSLLTVTGIEALCFASVGNGWLYRSLLLRQSDPGDGGCDGYAGGIGDHAANQHFIPCAVRENREGRCNSSVPFSPIGIARLHIEPLVLKTVAGRLYGKGDFGAGFDLYV